VSRDERVSSPPPRAIGADAAPDVEATGARSVGQYLANQRKLRRITLEELSLRTRIPRRNLEHLESGAFDAQDDGFTRGFVRTVAEALGLDAAEAVMRLVGEPRAEEDRALRAARRATLLRVAVLVFVAGLSIVGVMLCVRRETADTQVESPAVTYRRDAVRGLAEDSGEQVPSAPKPAADSPRE
jgi:cytoskeletal protein RodZ